MLDDFAGKGAVIGELTQIVAGSQIDDFLFDECKIGSIAGCGGQKSLVAPDVIGDTVPANAAHNVILGNPEAAQHDPFVGEMTKLIVERGREQQHEGGKVVDPGKVKSAITFAAQ